MLESPADTLARRNILIVEDEYFLAEELERELRRRGASIVGPFGKLEEARADLAGGRQIDAGVLDLRLQEDESIEVADLLKARGVPFVFTSGYDRSLLPQRHRDAAHFVKPCDIEEVVDALAALIG